MAPKLTGIRDADQARSIGLAEKAFDLAHDLVRPKGSFVAKVFQGRDTDAFMKRLKDAFEEVRILKPEATRQGSREVFVVAKSMRAR
jgi:23S rRNA (uridine2552-2'-O)-methyltransferase